MFPRKAIREMIGNMIIHQDLLTHGSGPMLEVFATKVEASNPGNLLVDVDRMEEGLSDLQIPAPKVETGIDFTRIKFYWYKDLNSRTREEKIRTCYLNTCYCYINDIDATNTALRNRFGVKDHNKSIISRIIKETIAEGYIKLADENTAPRYRKYIPYWA